MKNAYLLIGLCMVLCGCGEDAPPTKNSSYTTPTFKKSEPAVASPAPQEQQKVAGAQAAQSSQPAQPIQAAQVSVPPTTATGAPPTTVTSSAATSSAPAKDSKIPSQRPATQVMGDASAAIDYGTGAVPIAAKRKQADKIQSIQDQHNQKMKKALGE